MPLPERTPPSSRGKKLPKEGSPKFVGPQTQASVESRTIPLIASNRGVTKRVAQKRERERARAQSNSFFKVDRTNLRNAIKDRIGNALGTENPPPGARAAAAELIQAARKLQDPATREKVLKLIQSELYSYPSQYPLRPVSYFAL